MNAQDLKDWIVIPTLHAISEFIPVTESAINLLLGTAAKESGLYYLDQTTPGPGPAYGIYEMECETHNSHLAWLKQKEAFWKLVQSFQIQYLDNCLEMQGNLYYATIMARIHYWRAPAVLPASTDVRGMAFYWKKYYNTYLGAGKPEEFIESYNRLIKPLR